MRVTTKVEFKDCDIVIPKGTTGIVVSIRWGDKDGYVVEFPQDLRLFVNRDDVVITEEKTNALQKPRTAKEERENNE